ncbi:MAG: recombination protein O N-terminal domain-containing protein [Candidatus Peribacteraceae bacterium]|nr:recombination protein O N-terminal domain-containing protein [Candidatus Peribacteraceae bacterium]
MAHTCSVEALILHAYDVGEADRFLLLFTRERGRLAARARGVRRLGSRMGGHLLAHQHLSLILAESNAGWTVTSAQRLNDSPTLPIEQFAMAEEGCEILLALLHDEEALPEIFDLTLRFLHDCREGRGDPVLAFSLDLLRLLGLLPALTEKEFPGHLAPHVRRNIKEVLWNSRDITSLSPKLLQSLSILCRECIEEHTNHTSRCFHVTRQLKEWAIPAR